MWKRKEKITCVNMRLTEQLFFCKILGIQVKNNDTIFDFRWPVFYNVLTTISLISPLYTLVCLLGNRGI